MKEPLFTRSFTFLVLGQVCSLVGNLALRFALSMYVLEKTGSAAVFAGLLSLSLLPTVLLSPFGGILADRANRRNLMVILDCLSGVAVLLCALLLSPSGDIGVISALLVVLSVLSAFETPTVQACLPQMLSGELILRGNAVVNQVAALSALLTPYLGGLLYTALGLRPVLYLTVACFFLTALLECFIKLPHQKRAEKQGVVSVIKEDLSLSVHFLSREQPDILKLLLLAAAAGFFAVGALSVGLPYLVRTVLGLSTTHFGVAESLMGVAAILGGISVGILAKRTRPLRLHRLLVAVGLCFLPAAGAFLVQGNTPLQYGALLLSFCGVQTVCTAFSIFAVSAIQSRTPEHLTGKVMAYVSTLTVCAQPLGQLLYGLWFDACANQVYLVLLPTGLAVILLGLRSARLLANFTPS